MSDNTALYAALLQVVAQHCATSPVFTGRDADMLDSFGIKANAEAMALLAEAGLVEIEEEAGGRIIGRVSEAGRKILARDR